MGCCSYFYVEMSGSKAARAHKFLIFVLRNDCTFEFNCSQLKMARKRKASLNDNGTRKQNEVENRRSSRLMMWSNWYVFRCERRRSKSTLWWRICRSTCWVSVSQKIIFYVFSVLTNFIASWFLAGYHQQPHVSRPCQLSTLAFRPQGEEVHMMLSWSWGKSGTCKGLLLI